MEQWKPHAPDEGPPLPRFTPGWPFKSQAPAKPEDPELTHPSTVDSEIENLRERKRAEWQARGVRPGLIEKALDWASGWAWGLEKSGLYQPLLRKHPELSDEIARSLYEEGLKKAEGYIEAFDFRD